MTWVERGGVRLHVERAGSGPPLLFITGTGGDLRLRPNVFDSPLASAFDLVSFDQRGLGRSDQPEGPYSMADYADDAAAVLDGVGWDRVAVIGLSFGGMVAQELVLRHPERVGRLVLAATSSGGDGGSSYPLHELNALADRERSALMITLVDTRWSDPRRHDPFRDAMVSALASRTAPTPGALAQLEARRHHDTCERLGAVTCPVLVCGGRSDGIAPVANSEELARRIPGARLSLFDGGHLFLYQDPSAFPLIAAFLDEPAAQFRID